MRPVVMLVLYGAVLTGCADGPPRSAPTGPSAATTPVAERGAAKRTTPSPPGATRAAPTQRSATASATPERYRTKRRYQPVAAPVRIRIPAADVDARVERLGLAADGTIAVPRDFGVTGWWAGGPRPGQPGPAVILGHVDSKRGPAVFFHLASLRVGSVVHVDRADGSTASFRVTRRVQTRKKAFPTDDVYAPTLEPGLRLVTCGGTFDRATGHYRDNVIVFAAPV